MRYSFAASAILAASVGSVAGQGTCPGSELLGGNWYCSLIESIIYNGFPTSGTYKGVNSMGENGQCEFGEMNFNGPLGVFGEELSVHLRGPAQLKKLAVYSAGDGGNSKREEPVEHAHAHAHVHGHAHHARDHPRRFTQPEPVTVSAVVDGQPTSWVQDSIPTQPPSKREAAPVEVTATIFGQVVSWTQSFPQATPAALGGGNSPAGSADSASTSTVEQSSETSSPSQPQQKHHASSSSASSSSPKTPGKVKAGSWGRVAYYDASAGTADGLVFLNHKGGQGSGVWDKDNGNSLSYASKDAKSGASSPQVLQDALLEDDNEIVIMTDKKCDNDCGAVRPGTVAHHGWSGNNKVFVAEVTMPLTGKTGFNADMPSFWLLNAAIPRTNQYGDCSCWKGGCGEFDILEVLDSGNKRCKSTIHAVSSGGDSNYFDRPTDKSIHVAVVFDGDGKNAHIKVLNDFDYSGSLSSQQVQSLTQQAPKAASFKLGSS